MKLLSKEKFIGLKYVGTFRAMSDKKLARLRMEALKEVAEAHEFIRKHKGELKNDRARSRKAMAILEAIRQVQLEKALPEAQRQFAEIEKAKKVSSELLRTEITI